MCRRIDFLVTWMMDLGRISLDGHDLGKHDSYLEGLHGSYPVRATNTWQVLENCLTLSHTLDHTYVWRLA
jgi:hypothetical protein